MPERCDECGAPVGYRYLSGGTRYKRLERDARRKRGGMYPMLCPRCRKLWDNSIGGPRVGGTLRGWFK